MRTSLLAMSALVALGGCAYESRQPPVSLAPTVAGGPPSKAPESPNALPLGSQVDAPIVGPGANLNTVRVGPGSATPPVTSTQPPVAGLGTATAPARPTRVNNGY